MRINEVICLFIMFTPRVMVMTMSKMAHFLYFLLMKTKKLGTDWAKYLGVPERSY